MRKDDYKQRLGALEREIDLLRRFLESMCAQIALAALADDDQEILRAAERAARARLRQLAEQQHELAMRPSRHWRRTETPRWKVSSNVS